MATAVGRWTLRVTAAAAVALVGALLIPGPATWAQSTPPLGGTVRDAASGSPVAGAHVAVLRTTDFGLAAGAVAGPEGAFTVHGLSADSYFLYLVDPSGVHAAEFHGAPTAVATTATGGTAVEPLINRGVGALTGTVTSDGTGMPIPGAWVALLSAATGRPEGGAVAGADGSFHIDDVAVGRHLVVVVDRAGGHRAEFHDDAATITGATTIEVTPGSTTRITPELAPVTPPGASPSSLTGHVTESETSTPIAGAWVVALDSGTLALAGGARTLADGAYTLPLPTGRYLVEIVDPTGAHDVEWYDEHDPSDLASATPIQVEGTVAAVALRRPPCPHSLPPHLPDPSRRTRVEPVLHRHRCALGDGHPWEPGHQPVGRIQHRVRPSLPLPVRHERGLRAHRPDPTRGPVRLEQAARPLRLRRTRPLTERLDVRVAVAHRPLPRRLEITAYANNDGTHLTPPTPLVTLTQAQLDQPVPLWFELAVSADRQRYEFRIAGPGGRSASTTLPRQCPTGSTTALKWASGFYFGGTSTAPSPISGWIVEP